METHKMFFFFFSRKFDRILDEMEIESTPIDTKGFQKLIEVKDSTAKDSFDLFSGLFVHNRFAWEELTSLEMAFKKVKQKLLEKANEELDHSTPKSRSSI